MIFYSTLLYVNRKTPKTDTLTAFVLGIAFCRQLCYNDYIKKGMVNDMELANINSDIVNQIKNIIEQARQNVTVAVNHELLRSYWQIGKLIADSESANGLNETSARGFILALSKVLTNELGRGFSRSNLFNMRNFYLNYPDVQTASGHLSWSHYCELLAVSDKDARGFYEKECVNAHWSIRELRRQIESALFQRLLLSDGVLNKQKVLELSQKGQIIEKPEGHYQRPVCAGISRFA
jgi:predicted nuclease of restriction endonuclease-like (RecB) superfamily